MAPEVPMSDTGTTTLGMRAVRSVRKNTNTTRMTSRTERPRVRCTSCTEARMVMVRSGSASPAHLSLGTLGRAIREPGPPPLEPHPVPVKGGGIDAPPPGRECPAADDDAAHTRHLRQFLLEDGGGHVVHAGAADEV